MSTQYRSFTKAFLAHMAIHWPKWKDAKAGFEQVHGSGIKNDIYNDMRNGTAVADWYIRIFVKMLLFQRPGPDFAYYRDATLEFLARSGLATADTSDLERVLQILCNPATDTPISAFGESDPFLLGFGGFLQAIQLKRALNNAVQGCADEAEVREAITWMFVDFGRQLGAPKGCPTNVAVERTEQMMHLSLREYQTRAVNWWRANAWTVLLARGRDRPTGMSIVLPLPLDVRNNILNAGQMTYDCRPEDLIPPSQYLLHEGLAPRPCTLGGETGSMTFNLYLAVMAQVAVLSRYHRLPDSNRLTVVSISGTRDNRKRQEKFGYRPTGKHMRLTGIEFVEMILRPALHRPVHLLTHSMFIAFSKIYPSGPPL